MSRCEPSIDLPAAPWGTLPPRIRALHIADKRAGSWLAEALAADNASEVVLEEAIGVTRGLARLRDQVFDAVLVSHEPGELDALAVVEGLRTGGAEEAIVVLGSLDEQEILALCYEVGADGYVCVEKTTTRALLWTVSRAIERHNLIRENRRLGQAERHRLQQEQQEAIRLLADQWRLIRPEAPTGAAAENDLGNVLAPPALKTHYIELLRAHIIMGSGSLAGAMEELAQMLAGAGFTAQQAMQLHLSVLEELIRGLGSRSARHVMNRADLLAIELLVHFAECHRQAAQDRARPPRFDASAQPMSSL